MPARAASGVTLEAQSRDTRLGTVCQKTTTTAGATPRERRTARTPSPRGEPEIPEKVRRSTAPAGHMYSQITAAAAEPLRQCLVEALRLQHATWPAGAPCCGRGTPRPPGTASGQRAAAGNGAPMVALRWCAPPRSPGRSTRGATGRKAAPGRNRGRVARRAATSAPRSREGRGGRPKRLAVQQNRGGRYVAQLPASVIAQRSVTCDPTPSAQGPADARTTPPAGPPNGRLWGEGGGCRHQRGHGGDTWATAGEPAGIPAGPRPTDRGLGRDTGQDGTPVGPQPGRRGLSGHRLGHRPGHGRHQRGPVFSTPTCRGRGRVREHPRESRGA